MKHLRLLGLMLALALCVGLLSATPALAQEQWEHTDHSDGWKALTAENLTGQSQQLTSGKYYFSSDDPYKNFSSDTQLVVGNGQNVTLCLNDVMYMYIGSEEAAIVVQEGGTLTVCCCKMDKGMFNGVLFGSKYGIENNDTLTVTGGNLFTSMEEGAPIYNNGTLTVSDGVLQGSCTTWNGSEMVNKTAYGIYNDEKGKLTLSGSSSIMGTAPGPENDSPTGPKIDIMTHNTILVDNLSTAFLLSYNIGFDAEMTTPVVKGVNETTASFFNLTFPEGYLLAYSADNGGTLSCVKASSLQYCGQNVADKTYYKVENSDYSYGTGDPVFKISGLTLGDENDYDLYWDEESHTLTLNGLDAVSNGEGFGKAMFQANCDTLNVDLIGENKIKALSYVTLDNKDVYAIENTDGDVVIQPADGQTDASLNIELGLSKNCDNDHTVAGIVAGGKVENQAALSVTSTDAKDYFAQNIVGVYGADFDNQGTFTANMEEQGSGIDAVYCTNSFSNNGGMELEIKGKDVCGSALDGATSFTNSGMIKMDLDAEYSAQGIYCNTDQFVWNNDVAGDITIKASGNGGPVGPALSRPVAGMNLLTDNITFSNNGSLSLTAVRKEKSPLTNITWPIGQSFDTIGLAIYCEVDGGTVDNSGTMILNAENGNSAGMDIISNTKDVSISSSGTLQASAASSGGEHVWAVGLYGEIKSIADGQVKNLPFTLSGEVEARAAAAQGSTVASENLMAVCLVQSFNGTAPKVTDAFQQIRAEAGYLLPGTPVVKQQDAANIINTIAGADGQPIADLHLLKQISGTVSIEGSPVVGATLSASASNLPVDLADYTYQWQSGESADGPFTDIQDATESTYTLTGKDVGKYIRVVITPNGDIYGGVLTATTTSSVSHPSTGAKVYSISVEPGDNGSVAVSHRNAVQGATVTVNVTPDEGYVLARLTVTDEDGNAVELVKKNDGTYTFKMPASKVAVKATFAKDIVTLPFIDVHPGDWFYDPVCFVYSQGLMTGTSDTTFEPNTPLSRAMLVAVLHRLEGSPAASVGDFSDVAVGDWYAQAVNWAASVGVVNGFDDGTFQPNAAITREQMAAILRNYAQYKGMDVTATGDLSTYTDAASVSDWAKESMQWAVGEGLLSGMTVDTLQPQGLSTRAQVAAVLQRYLEN